MYPGSAARELWAASGLESPDVFFERAFAALQKESPLATTTPSRYLKANETKLRLFLEQRLGPPPREELSRGKDREDRQRRSP